jgi:ribonuclease HI
VPKASWFVYYDGGWGVAGVGAATILVSPSGIKLCYAARLQFHSETDKCTNNIVEYEAILFGLRKLIAIRVQTCTLSCGGANRKRLHSKRIHPQMIFSPR